MAQRLRRSAVLERGARGDATGGRAARASSGSEEGGESTLQRSWRLLSEARELAGGRRGSEAFYNSNDPDSAALAAAVEAKELALALQSRTREVERLKEAREALVEYAVEAKRSASAAKPREDSRHEELLRLRQELDDALYQANEVPKLQARVAELEQGRQQQLEQEQANSSEQPASDQMLSLRAQVRKLESDLAEQENAQEIEQRFISALMEEKAHVAKLSSELERERKEKEGALEQARNNADQSEIERLTTRTRELESQLAESYSADELNRLRAQIIEEASRAKIEESQQHLTPQPKSTGKKEQNPKEKEASALLETDHISESSISPTAREGNGATPNPTAAAMQLSDRTKPFKRKEAAQFKLRKRIFPSSWRREGAASSTSPAVLANVTVSLNSRKQPFQRNQPSDFKLRKRIFNSSSRKPSLSADSDSGGASNHNRTFRRGDTSQFKLRKGAFSSSSRKAAPSQRGSADAEQPTSEAFLLGSLVGCLMLVSAASGGALLSASSGMLHLHF